jgi:site-specific DNA-methyltransferase (adenine-specific)
MKNNTLLQEPIHTSKRKDSASVLELFDRHLFISKHGMLFKGDCFDLFSMLKSNSIDLIFADPPFNLNKDYGPHADDNMTADKYLNWTKAWLDESIRVLKPGGAIYVYNIPKWSTYIAAYLNERLNFRHWIAINMKNTYPRGNILYPAHYALLYYTKGEPKTFQKLRIPVPTCRHCKKELRDYGGHRDKLNPLGLNLSDFWEDTSPVRHNKFKRRVANELKPMIPNRAIEMSTNLGEIVLDPFGGGGSTYAEAEKLERLWIGSELHSDDAIISRLVDECEVVFGEKINPLLAQALKCNF